MRRLAAKLPGPQRSPTVRHYYGLPPELTGGNDERREITGIALLLIEERDGGFFLERFTESGVYLTDTWHQTLDDAKHQATFEYPGIEVIWREVPDSSEDAVAFGLST